MFRYMFDCRKTITQSSFALQFFSLFLPMYAEKYCKKPIRNVVVAKQIIGLSGLFTNALRMVEDYTWTAYASEGCPFGEVPPQKYFNKKRIDALIDHAFETIDELSKEPSFKLPGDDLPSEDDVERSDLISTNKDQAAALKDNAETMKDQESVKKDQAAALKDSNAVGKNATELCVGLMNENTGLKEEKERLKERLRHYEEQPQPEPAQQAQPVQQPLRPRQVQSQLPVVTPKKAPKSTSAPSSAKKASSKTSSTPSASASSKKAPPSASVPSSAKKASSKSSSASSASSKKAPPSAKKTPKKTPKKAISKQHDFEIGDGCTVREDYYKRKYAGKDGVIEGWTAEYVQVYIEELGETHTLHYESVE